MTIEGNGEVGLEMFPEARRYKVFSHCGEIVLHSHSNRESLEKLNEAKLKTIIFKGCQNSHWKAASCPRLALSADSHLTHRRQVAEI